MSRICAVNNLAFVHKLHCGVRYNNNNNNNNNNNTFILSFWFRTMYENEPNHMFYSVTSIDEHIFYSCRRIGIP